MGGELKLPAELIPFFTLSLLHGEVRRIEVSRRVGHRRVEPELEKVVSEIVVLADVVPALGLAIRAERMPDPVDCPEEVESPGRARFTRLDSGKVIAIQDKPRQRPRQILGLPLPGEVASAKPIGPKSTHRR